MIGICAGAQFIAKKFGSTISKLKGHVGNHKIYLNKDYRTINLKKVIKKRVKKNIRRYS